MTENVYREPPEKIKRDLMTQEFLKASQKKRGKYDCARQSCAMISLCCILYVGLMIVATLWIGLIVYLIVGGSDSSHHDDKPTKLRFASYPDTQYQKIIDPNTTYRGYQWIGGDSSASVVVPFLVDGEEYSIFLYGDSLFGEVDKYGNRIIPPITVNITMINNLVGLYNTDMDHIKMFPRINYSAPLISRYQSLFLPTNTSIHLWAMQGVVLPHNSTFFHLFIFTPRVVNVPNIMVLDGFGVIKCGISKSIVLNPLLWDCPYHDIYSHEGDLDFGYVGNYVNHEDGYVYMLGNSLRFETEAVLTRIKKEYLLALRWERMEYWSIGSKWTTTKLNLQPLEGFPATTETSLNYNNYTQKYYTIMIPTLGTFDAYIYLADDITGPYKKFGPVFTVPKNLSSYEHMIAYAVKSHPQLVESDQEILVTYNTNSWPPIYFEEMFYRIKELVIPQFVRIKLDLYK